MRESQGLYEKIKKEVHVYTLMDSEDESSCDLSDEEMKEDEEAQRK